MVDALSLENNSIDIAEKWVVHAQYGIGQIKGVDEKEISGEKAQYYRVKTKNSTFWVPTNQINNEMLRPLSAPEDIQEAIDILQKSPKSMSPNAKIRQTRIRETRQRNTPQAIARLIRDLRELQREKTILNQNERSALQNLKQRLAEEWAVVVGLKAEQAAVKLDALLNVRH
ncbi:MAG: CarD family transcriptional regulator [Chloroflexota bacterium]